MEDLIPNGISESLENYIQGEIIPRYDSFDPAHRRDHVQKVIEQSLDLAEYYDVDTEMVYVIAAYHDIGLSVDRKTHHLVSGQMLLLDEFIKGYFSPSQIQIMAEAIEDHRASAKSEPRTIYGKIIAEADRQIIPEVIIRRTIQYGLANYSELDKEGHWERTWSHLQEKYARGGYLKLWIPISQNAKSLAKFQTILDNKDEVKQLFNSIFDECKKPLQADAEARNEKRKSPIEP